MKIIQSIKDINEEFGLTIGNFDGVHLGHQDLLNKVKDQCVQNKLKMTVMTFIPHPQKILFGDKKHFLLCDYEKRRELLKKMGVDFLVEIDFSRDFSTIDPEHFLKTFLFSNPKLKSLYLGYDFAFGANKQGTFQIAQKIAEEHKIKCELQEKFLASGDIISSSKIREFMEKGNIEQATKFLGYNFSINGLIVRGVGRGKTIGFPTANLSFDSDLIVPARGVYITKTIHAHSEYNSVTNIGFNPTFKDDNILHVEDHILSFNKDIYGEKIEVIFYKKIRDEKKFSGIDELVKQIKLDANTSLEYFKK
jgi:riboflavin kinase/FMN adenylyltransferase